MEGVTLGAAGTRRIWCTVPALLTIRPRTPPAHPAPALGQGALRGIARQGPVPDCRDAVWFCPADPGPAVRRPERIAATRSRVKLSIKLENVGIAVRDLEAAIASLTDFGLIFLGRDTASGEWTDTAVDLDSNHANIAMLQTPDGDGRLELFGYIHHDAIETKPPGLSKSQCIASPSRSMTSTRPSRSPRGTAAMRCATWRPDRTCAAARSSATVRPSASAVVSSPAPRRQFMQTARWLNARFCR